MKKILFLLLFTSAIYAQTSTGQEQSFPYGIINESAQTVINPNTLVTHGADGTYGKASVNNIPISIAVQDSLNKKINLPTGFLQGLQLSINVDPTKFNIAAGYYVVTDFTNLAQPVVKIITYPGATGLTPAYLATANSTYVALDINGNVVSSASPFTNEDLRTLCLVGNVVHSNHTAINVTNEIKASIVATTNQFHSFMRLFGPMNKEGNVYSVNGANLWINKSIGKIAAMGVNPHNYLNPNELSIPAQTAPTFAYRLPSGTQLADTQNIDPNNYVNAGTLTAVPVGNKWTITRLYLFASGITRAMHGQAVYNSYNDAKAGLSTEDFTVEQNIAENSVFRTYIIVKQGTTDLSAAVAAGTASFHAVDMLNNVISNSSVSLTYSNIVAALGYTPENLANKATNFNTVNNALYPSVQAVKNFVSTYNGQTWGVLGDSFAQIDLFQPALLSKLGITSLTDGIGGSCITGGTNFAEGDAINRVPFVDRIVAMLANSITGIIVEGGSNDFHYNIPLGRYGSTDVNTFYGALDYICDKIANRPTKIKAFFITPTFRGDSQHGGSSTGLANWENMKPYITAIKTICSKYAIQVIDEFGSGINFYNTDVYTTDGVHPNNADGTELYTNFLTDNIGANAGTLNVTPLDISASYELDPTFKRTIYWDKHGSDLQDDAAIVLTNTVDADLRIKVTSPASGLYASIGTGKVGVNLALQELYGKVLVGTNSSVSDDKFQVSGTGLINSGASATGFRVSGTAGGGWSGRLVAGGSSSVFLMGEYAGNAWLGAHNSSLSAWNDLYLNPDGGASLYMGKYSGSPILTINNTTGISAFTGTPTAPTATAGTNTTQIATTAFVQGIKPYKVYTALLSQSGTSAPTATVLENTLGGTIVWSRSNTGQYIGTLTGAFTDQKTIIFVNRSNPAATAFDTNMAANVININTVGYTTFSNSAYVDGQTNSASIEIRVYN